MKTSQHPVFGRVFIFVLSIAELLIAITLFYSLQSSVWAKGWVAYSCLIIGLGVVLYQLGFIVFAEDVDIQIWMDEHIFREPVYLYQMIFHFTFFLSLLLISHIIFIFLRLFLAKNKSD